MWLRLLFILTRQHLLEGRITSQYTTVCSRICFSCQRSIHPNQLEAINSDLEKDRMVRALYDIKATDMGSQSVMFKAEVDIDGRQITRSYLERIDIQVLLEVIEKPFHEKKILSSVCSSLGIAKDQFNRISRIVSSQTWRKYCR